MNEIKIMIVDDHQIIVDGLEALLNDVEGVRVVATAENGREALDMLKLFDVDLILMDIDMPVMNGLEATKAVKAIKPSPYIIILSMHLQKGMIEDLIKLGVDGYVLKNSDKEQLTNAIFQVAAGKKYFGPNVTLTLLGNDTGQKSRSPDDAVDLTVRELEILKLIAEGYTNKEIGEKLFISHRTVDTHRTNMMKKLNVNNVAGLINYAIKNGIIS
ncbi:MAG: response regulator transcription factor [Chlorobi bacterium]|nr:response regulator transcription factor [Chlorobiota bacterium]